MFAGIIEETGKIRSIIFTPEGIRLKVQIQKTAGDLKIGNSIALNGCCLTATAISKDETGPIVSVDLLEETWKKTNLQHLKKGSLVNLERPLRVNGRLEGHLLTGHIEAMGRVCRWEEIGRDWCLEIETPRSILKYVVEKGSVAIDGMSLTVAEIISHHLRFWIIPHTYKTTRLKQIISGDYVNIETDIISKYVERIIKYEKYEKYEKR